MPELIPRHVSGLAGSFLLLSESNSALISPLFSNDKIALLGLRKLGLHNVLTALSPLVIGELRKGLDKKKKWGEGQLVD